MSKRVHIVGHYGNQPYEAMFNAYGWEVTNLMQADMLCFTGGSDISPSRYFQAMHPKTGMLDPARDADEFGLASGYLATLPMVGICRGAQLLNVVCGGRLYQHVEGHMSGHNVETYEGEFMWVPSDHHQMMIPNTVSDVDVLMWHNRDNRSGRRETYHKGEFCDPYNSLMHDIEALYYRDEKVLCFQSHPEYLKPGAEFPDFFFQEIDRRFNVGKCDV